jgi:Cytochrome oxidase complex assembly protein 1
MIMKNIKWIIVSILGAVLVIGLVTALLAGLMKLMKGEVYQKSVKLIQHDSRVKRMLGKKLEFSFFVTGNISESGDAGVATFQYTVDGSKKDAEVFVSAERKQGKWYLVHVIVTDKKSDQRIYVVGQPVDY